MRVVQVECRNGVTTFPDVDEGTVADYGPSLTRQSERDAADINVILRQYERTGMMPLNELQAVFEDVSEFGDYRANLEKVRAADAAFAELDPRVRTHFGGDPAQLLAAIADPAREAELRELGVLPPKAAVAQDVAPPKG